MLALIVWLFWLQVDVEWENVDLLRPVHRCPRGHAVMNWVFVLSIFLNYLKRHYVLVEFLFFRPDFVFSCT